MKRPTMVCIFGAFHYDVAYRQTFDDYLPMSLDAIRAGLELLTEHPEYVFVIEQVALVRELVHRYPEWLSEMQRFAQKGRLVFAPGMLTMPDVNIPSAETFIRNFLLGRDWLVEHLGVEPKVCWMADIFGHHPQMPQLAKLCGYEGYMFERGKVGGEEAVFWWQGIDGSQVATQWQVDTYGGLCGPLSPYLAARGLAWMAEFLDKMYLEPLRDRSARPSSLLSAIGGDFRRPLPGDIDFIRDYNRLDRPFHLAWGSPERYFQELTKDTDQPLPVVRADFNPLMAGTYSSRIRLKQSHRRLEHLAAALELLETAGVMAGRSLPDRAGELWELLAWNSFHDILAGTLEDQAFREALRDYTQAERKACVGLQAAITDPAFLTGPVGMPEDSPVVALYNPLPYPRDEWVEIPLRDFGKDTRAMSLCDTTGRPVEVQSLTGSQEPSAKGSEVMDRKVVAEAPASRPQACIVLAKVHLPATAIGSYRFCRKENLDPKNVSSDLVVREDLLENRFLRIVLGKNGTLVSLYDKQAQREWADPARSSVCQKGMNNLLLQADQGDLWTLYQAPVNGSLLYASPMPDPMPPSGIELQRRGSVGTVCADADAIEWPTINVVERGPLRAAVDITYPATKITSRISLARDEKLIRFQTRFFPQGKHYRLRAAFPTNLKGGRIRSSIPCGFLERPEGEHPAQGWIEYADRQGGLCLLNRGLPGNNITDGVLLLSLFRAVAMEDVDKAPWYEEGVEQVFDYALRPFGTADRDYDPARLAERFNQPLIFGWPQLDQAVPHLDSVVEFEAGPAELMGFRKVGTEYELRLHESKGTGGLVTIGFSKTVATCRRTDVAGKLLDGTPIRIEDRRLTLDLTPFQIVTLRLTF